MINSDIACISTKIKNMSVVYTLKTAVHQDQRCLIRELDLVPNESFSIYTELKKFTFR